MISANSSKFPDDVSEQPQPALLNTVDSANHHSVTVTNGTGTNTILTTSWTDNDGHPVLTVGFPLPGGEGQGEGGTREFTLQSFDLAGNKVAWQQCSQTNGAITIWATNGWTYNAQNQVATETVRDGATTTFTRDAMGNILNRTMPNSVSWLASYANDGRILSERDSGGGASAHSLTYAYFPSSSPFAGLLQTVTDARGVIKTNSYDDDLRVVGINAGGDDLLDP